MKLTDEELASPLWKKLESHLQAKLDLARKKNDFSQSDSSTNELRGGIKAYKEILGLAEREM